MICRFSAKSFLPDRLPVALPESVITASTTDSFKNKLDKFWSNQDLIFNYKAELTELGNSSFINNLD